MGYLTFRCPAGGKATAPTDLPEARSSHLNVNPYVEMITWHTPLQGETVWRFVVHGIGDRFSDGGDSGSLVVHQDDVGVRHAVGIVVGGAADSSAPGGKISLIMPITPILEELGLTLVSNHNV